ncbi:hypothetical protein [Oryzobacter telluris]|uniref:hypothetical protein n=1 Tax=Oryzobacter telluris TaxID=3149179 RepID=UPI00370DA805
MHDVDPIPEAEDPALGVAASPGQYWDTNADGYVDTITVQDASGSVDVFTDADEDGVFEGAAVVRADGTVAAAFRDSDENGAYDVGAVDQTGNGVLDTSVIDADRDGVLDTVVATDLDENGVADAAGLPVLDTVVGPATNPDPVYNLIVSMAQETGRAVFPASDRDLDGVSDDQDRHPSDPTQP